MQKPSQPGSRSAAVKASNSSPRPTMGQRVTTVIAARAYAERRLSCPVGDRGSIVRNRFVASVLAVGTLLSSFAAVGTAAAGSEEGRHRARTIKVGAASRSVLPTIDGTHDYLDAV